MYVVCVCIAAFICWYVLIVEGTWRESDVLFASVDWGIHKGKNLALKLQVLVGNMCEFTFTTGIFFVTGFLLYLWSFLVCVCCGASRCECDQG